MYGRMAVGGRYRVCEKEAVATLKDLLQQRLRYSEYDGARFLDAVQNARLVTNAERYYRIMYYGSNLSLGRRIRHQLDYTCHGLFITLSRRVAGQMICR